MPQRCTVLASMKRKMMFSTNSPIKMIERSPANISGIERLFLASKMYFASITTQAKEQSHAAQGQENRHPRPHGFEQSELEVPRDRLKEKGAMVVVISPEAREIRGWENEGLGPAG